MGGGGGGGTHKRQITVFKKASKLLPSCISLFNKVKILNTADMRFLSRSLNEALKYPNTTVCTLPHQEGIPTTSHQNTFSLNIVSDWLKNKPNGRFFFKGKGITCPSYIKGVVSN